MSTVGKTFFSKSHPPNTTATQIRAPSPANTAAPRPLNRFAKNAAQRANPPPLMGQFPRPPKTAAGGRPLLVGRPPCMRSAAGTETKRSTQAPCSWGLGASTSSQRHWLAALPPRRHWLAALPARRRQAPARGPAAVCTHSRSIRNETQQTRPLLVGRVCVYFEPTALAAGTAGSQKRSSSVLPSAWQIFRQRLMVGL